MRFYTKVIMSILFAVVLCTGCGQGRDGIASAACFHHPYAVAVDRADNIYVADSGNHTIRKITPSGVVTTLAGKAGSPGSVDGTGKSARFRNPCGLGVDRTGNIYIGDLGNHTIRKLTPEGVVTTLAGTAGSVRGTDGSGAAARFNCPDGVAVDGTNNIFVADAGNNTIRKITLAGVVTTLAGKVATADHADGIGSASRFNAPSGCAVDKAGNIFVADRDTQTIRKITPSGMVTTLAGTAWLVGKNDGIGVAARFNRPTGVAVDSTGNIFVADAGNHTIRKITPAGVVTTLAGTAGLTGSADGIGAAARFNLPAGVAVDSAGNIFVADTNNNTIRKITSSGVVTTLAGKARWKWGHPLKAPVNKNRGE